MRLHQVINPSAVHSNAADPMNLEDLQKLVTIQMPFGQHKGCLLVDLPGNHLNWFAREGIPSGEIGRLLAFMHEIDHNGLTHLLSTLRPSPS